MQYHYSQEKGVGYGVALYRNPAFKKENLKGIWAESVGPIPDYQKLFLPVAEEFCAHQQVTIGHPVLMTDRSGIQMIIDSILKIKDNVVEAERRLIESFPATAGRSFCYPCYQKHVGVGNNRHSYVPVIAKYFVAGRARGEFGVNYPATCDIHCLWSWNVEGMDLFELIGRVEQAICNEQWCIFTFHGIDDGRLSVSSYDFGELLKYLASNSSRVWVDAVANVANRVIRWRKARRDEENSQDN